MNEQLKNLLRFRPALIKTRNVSVVRQIPAEEPEQAGLPQGAGRDVQEASRHIWAVPAHSRLFNSVLSFSSFFVWYFTALKMYTKFVLRYRYFVWNEYMIDMGLKGEKKVVELCLYFMNTIFFTIIKKKIQLCKKTTN